MERLIVDAHTGRLEQHFAWRGDYYRQGPQSYAAPVPVGGGIYASAPRPEVDIGGPRMRSEEFPGSDDEMRGIRQRQTAYGGDARMPLVAPPALDVKPVDKFEAEGRRPAETGSVRQHIDRSIRRPSDEPASSSARHGCANVNDGRRSGAGGRGRQACRAAQTSRRRGKLKSSGKHAISASCHTSSALRPRLRAGPAEKVDQRHSCRAARLSQARPSLKPGASPHAIARSIASTAARASETSAAALPRTTI